MANPVGILALVGVLLVYGGLVARYVAPWLMPWPVLAQTVAYALLGAIWLLPLRRFLIWMETGDGADHPLTPRAQQLMIAGPCGL
jgi:membrane protein implicated in regulation of membrane protease activity